MKTISVISTPFISTHSARAIWIAGVIPACAIRVLSTINHFSTIITSLAVKNRAIYTGTEAASTRNELAPRWIGHFVCYSRLEPSFGLESLWKWWHFFSPFVSSHSRLFSVALCFTSNSSRSSDKINSMAHSKMKSTLVVCECLFLSMSINTSESASKLAVCWPVRMCMLILLWGAKTLIGVG